MNFLRNLQTATDALHFEGLLYILKAFIGGFSEVSKWDLNKNF